MVTSVTAPPLAIVLGSSWIRKDTTMDPSSGATGDINDVVAAPGAAAVPEMSKKARKRQERYESRKVNKKMKKAEQKAAKAAARADQPQADGRPDDLGEASAPNSDAAKVDGKATDGAMPPQAERMSYQQKNNETRRDFEERASRGPTIVVDCSFDADMNEREVRVLMSPPSPVMTIPG